MHRNSFFIVLEAKKFKVEGPHLVTDFSLRHTMMVGGRAHRSEKEKEIELLASSLLIIGINSFMRVVPSQPNHLSKVPHLNIVALGIKLPTYAFLEKTLKP